jgi:hypothetical protein
MKELGTKLILSAAAYHGATSKMISIDWKFDKIIVIVDISADEDYIGDAGTNGGAVSCAVGDLIDDDEFDDDELLEYELFDDYDDIDYDDDNEEEFDEEEEDFETLQQQLGLQEQNDEQEEGKNQDDQKRTTIDLTLIARTINEYLSQDGEDSLAFQIAKLHEIEVTTPEFDNVLRDYSNSGNEEEGGGGVNMFEVYKGFDVIVDYWEVPKQKKKKKSGKAGKEVVAVAEEESATTAEEKDEEEEEQLQKTKKVIEGKLVGRDNDKGVTMVNVKGRITKIKNDMIESVKLPKAKREKGVK